MLLVDGRFSFTSKCDVFDGGLTSHGTTELISMKESRRGDFARSLDRSREVLIEFRSSVARQTA